MVEINLKIQWNEAAEDWSLEINGHHHEHIPSGVLEALVEAAVVNAERLLSEKENLKRL